jgi:hypothetical protein
MITNFSDINTLRKRTDPDIFDKKRNETNFCVALPSEKEKLLPATGSYLNKTSVCSLLRKTKENGFLSLKRLFRQGVAPLFFYS